jgi:hypothetical protein
VLLQQLQITAVISAHNDASKAYNLTAIVASLNSPMDFSMYIQNFTHQVCAALASIYCQKQHASSSARRRPLLKPGNVHAMCSIACGSKQCASYQICNTLLRCSTG